jgi:hypothetical protein
MNKDPCLCLNCRGTSVENLGGARGDALMIMDSNLALRSSITSIYGHEVDPKRERISQKPEEETMGLPGVRVGPTRDDALANHRAARERRRDTLIAASKHPRSVALLRRGLRAAMLRSDNREILAGVVAKVMASQQMSERFKKSLVAEVDAVYTENEALSAFERLVCRPSSGDADERSIGQHQASTEPSPDLLPPRAPTPPDAWPYDFAPPPATAPPEPEPCDAAGGARSAPPLSVAHARTTHVPPVASRPPAAEPQQDAPPFWTSASSSLSMLAHALLLQ